MNKYFNISLFIGLFLLVACESNNLTIQGNLYSLKKGDVKLMDESGNVLVKDSIQEGRFTIMHHMDYPQFVILVVDSCEEHKLYSRLLVCNTTINIEANPIEHTVKYSGASLNDEYLSYVNYLHSLPELHKLRKLNRTLISTSSYNIPEEKFAIQKEMSMLRDTILYHLLHFRPNSSKSQAAAALVYEEVVSLSLHTKKYAVSLFDADFRDSYYLNLLRKQIKQESSN